MGWGNYLFLGSLGNQLDLQDHESNLRSLRQSIQSSRWAERDQATQMDSLCKENQELRVYLTALSQLLIAKGTITAEEMSTLAETVERSAQPTRAAAANAAVEAAVDTSAELFDLQQAVDESHHRDA